MWPPLWPGVHSTSTYLCMNSLTTRHSYLPLLSTLSNIVSTFTVLNSYARFVGGLRSLNHINQVRLAWSVLHHVGMIMTRIRSPDDWLQKRSFHTIKRNLRTEGCILDTHQLSHRTNIANLPHFSDLKSKISFATGGEKWRSATRHGCCMSVSMEPATSSD